MERVERALRKSYRTGLIIEIASGICKVFTVEVLDEEGKQVGGLIVVVSPDQEVLNVCESKEMIEL